MVLFGSVDGFGLHNLVMGFLLDVVSQLLFIYHPAVVLTVVPVDFLFFDIVRSSQPAVQLPLRALDFVVRQHVPYYIINPVLSFSSFMPSPFIRGSTAYSASSFELNTRLQEESLIHSIRKWGLIWK